MNSAANTRTDVIVVGGGLAGSILAWTLRERGLATILIDDPFASSCSRAAAGLYHPITGRRLSLTNEATTLIKAGQDLFQRIESASGRRIDHQLTIRRAFADPEMRETWTRKRIGILQAGLRIKEFDPVVDGPVPAPHGGYELEGCGYVDTKGLIGAVADSFAAEGRLVHQRISPLDIHAAGSGFKLAGIETKKVVFAEGHLGRRNPLWTFLPFKPSRGEILEIRMAEPIRRCIHLGDLFLVPKGNELWAAGATHEWSGDSDEPTLEGRATLEARLRQCLRVGFEVVGQAAGVRPASGDTQPFVGRHPEQSGTWIFNGFGSRSVLLAPTLANRMADALIEGRPIPREISTQRFVSEPAIPRRIRANRIAQDKIAEIIGPGDRVIDATTGNGHDAAWLARVVGPSGRVLACDIQEAAIATTRSRLEAEALADRVLLRKADHRNLLKLAPEFWIGGVAAVMINLGPLAHGDPLIRTATDSTLEALNAVIQLLRPGGRLTVILHPGDPTGRAETLAVRAWFDGQSTARFTIEEIRPPNAPDTASDVMVLTRVG